jgi:MFS family permease
MEVMILSYLGPSVSTGAAGLSQQQQLCASACLAKEKQPCSSKPALLIHLQQQAVCVSHLAQAKCQWDLTATEEAGLNSVVFAGMCVGAPVWGMVSDTYGRKTSFFLATLISAVFGFATAAAPNFHVSLFVCETAGIRYVYVGHVAANVPVCTMAAARYTPTPTLWAARRCLCLSALRQLKE